MSWQVRGIRGEWLWWLVATGIAAGMAGCAIDAGEDAASEDDLPATAETQAVEGGTPIDDPRVVQFHAALTCSGVRITNQWILTAAHCVVRNEAGHPVVAPGDVIDLSTGARSYDQVIVHPSYVGDVGYIPEVDIALLHRAIAFDVIRQGPYGQPLDPSLLALTGNEDYLVTDLAEASPFDLQTQAIQCEGFGGTTGLLTAAQFTIGTVGTYADRWLALPTNPLGQHLTVGDSGGPCFPIVNGQVQPLVLSIASFSSATSPYVYATFGPDLRAWVTSIIPQAQRVEGLGLATSSRAAGFDVLLPKQGRPLTLTGSTADAPVGFTASCGLTGPSPAVYYRLTLTQPEMIYADSFGSSFDTVLFLTQNPTGDTQDTGFVCSDDSCSSVSSQIAQRLPPGTYFLGVSGFNGARGTYAVTLQHLPMPSTLQAIPSIAPNSPSIPTVFNTLLGGDTTATEDGTSSVCGGTGAHDWAFFFTTCPGFEVSALHAAMTASTAWDTVVTERDGNASLVERTQPRLTCDDDSAGHVQSLMSMVPTAGAGVHALYVDGYSAFAKGPFTMLLQIDHDLHVKASGGTTSLAAVGGTGGGPSPFGCEAGDVLVGIDGRAGTYVDRVSGLCATPRSDGTLGPYRHTSLGAGGLGGSTFVQMCPPNYAAIGVTGRAGTFVDAIGLECAPALQVALLDPLEIVTRPLAGGPGGSAFGGLPFGTAGATRCPVGQVLVGFTGQAGDYVDRLQAQCMPLSRR